MSAVPASTEDNVLRSTDSRDTSASLDVRQAVLAAARTVVVKVGSNVLSNPDDSLNADRIRAFATQIDRIRNSGRQVLIVSSGAVAAGIGRLRLRRRPSDLAQLQAAAAAGQAHLIRMWDEAFSAFGFHAAQILVTNEDFKRRARYLNVSNTLRTLFEYGAVPVVNENDTVSTEEIRFGDNDRLAAMVTNLLTDPVLVILSVVDGLFDGDPAQPQSKRIPLVPQWTDELQSLALDIRSSRGTGGMHTKLQAVRIATSIGASVFITSGERENVLDHLMAGEDLGTLFVARRNSLSAWKRWIAYTIIPRGRLVLDEGAVRAVRERGSSLLAIGVTDVDGDFAEGDLVALADSSHREFARGLINYDSRTTRRILGRQSHEIEKILGHLPYGSVVHRDNLVVTG